MRFVSTPNSIADKRLMFAWTWRHTHKSFVTPIMQLFWQFVQLWRWWWWWWVVVAQSRGVKIEMLPHVNTFSSFIKKKLFLNVGFNYWYTAFNLCGELIYDSISAFWQPRQGIALLPLFWWQLSFHPLGVFMRVFFLWPGSYVSIGTALNLGVIFKYR